MKYQHLMHQPLARIKTMFLIRRSMNRPFCWRRTIWSESYEGYPDQESNPIFLPFIPFVYAYTWLKFYRNGYFCNVPPENRLQEFEQPNGKHRYYYLFIN